MDPHQIRGGEVLGEVLGGAGFPLYIFIFRHEYPFLFYISFFFCKFAVNTWGAQDLVQCSPLGMASKRAE
jgi:hypothetical protein